MTYQPAQDSFLLSKQIEKYLQNIKNNNIKALDMGSGSGIQAKTIIKAGIKRENILCIDQDKKAVEYLKKQNLKTIKSDLFSKIKKSKKFDLIVFNPPYLPEDKYDKEKDTTAGKKGYETIIKFLRQAKNHLKKNAAILLLFSSLSKPQIILKFAKNNGYKCEKIAEEYVGMFETLFVYKIILK
jgi:HemK-related putative methylase